MDKNKIFFFTMKLQSSLQRNFGKEIATRTGVMLADNLEQAEDKIWEKYGSDNACGLDVWEVEDGESECFTVYYK